jgi:hypothetical protein
MGSDYIVVRMVNRLCTHVTFAFLIPTFFKEVVAAFLFHVSQPPSDSYLEFAKSRPIPRDYWVIFRESRFEGGVKRPEE